MLSGIVFFTFVLLFSDFAFIHLRCIATVPHQKYFLRNPYKVKQDLKQSFYVRQVPGDGGCLFHAISAWLFYIKHSKHEDFDRRHRSLSNKLRDLSISILRSNSTLAMENGEYMTAGDLLQMVAEHYNMTSSDYCDQMLDPKTWGGGPEIVALSNYFQCPIHVYQLATGGLITSPCFRLELCAKFGSPDFDDAALPIQILCADGRFPDVQPGKHKSVGDHFLALFPVDDVISQIQQQESQMSPKIPETAPQASVSSHASSSLPTRSSDLSGIFYKSNRLDQDDDCDERCYMLDYTHARDMAIDNSRGRSSSSGTSESNTGSIAHHRTGMRPTFPRRRTRRGFSVSAATAEVGGRRELTARDYELLRGRSSKQEYGHSARSDIVSDATDGRYRSYRVQHSEGYTADRTYYHTAGSGSNVDVDVHVQSRSARMTQEHKRESPGEVRDQQLGIGRRVASSGGLLRGGEMRILGASTARGAPKLSAKLLLVKEKLDNFRQSDNVRKLMDEINGGAHFDPFPGIDGDRGGGRAGHRLVQLQNALSSTSSVWKRPKRGVSKEQRLKIPEDLDILGARRSLPQCVALNGISTTVSAHDLSSGTPPATDLSSFPAKLPRSSSTSSSASMTPSLSPSMSPSVSPSLSPTSPPSTTSGSIDLSSPPNSALSPSYLKSSVLSLLPFSSRQRIHTKSTGASGANTWNKSGLDFIREPFETEIALSCSLFDASAAEDAQLGQLQRRRNELSVTRPIVQKLRGREVSAKRTIVGKRKRNARVSSGKIY